MESFIPMHIENLKIFRDLVDNESFSKAAKLNAITQSAVSQQLRSMEKHFNVLIVDRSQKQFRLTREGRSLYEAAKDILNRYEQVGSEMQEMRKVVSGTVHISTIVSIGLHELPPHVKSFMQEFPHVNVRVEYRRSNLVYEDVISNAVDFGLVAFPQKTRQVEIIPLMEDQLVAICSPRHKLAGKKEIDLADLQGGKFIGFDQDIPTARRSTSSFANSASSSNPPWSSTTSRPSSARWKSTRAWRWSPKAPSAKKSSKARSSCCVYATAEWPDRWPSCTVRAAS